MDIDLDALEAELRAAEVDREAELRRQEQSSKAIGGIEERIAAEIEGDVNDTVEAFDVLTGTIMRLPDMDSATKHHLHTGCDELATPVALPSTHPTPPTGVSTSTGRKILLARLHKDLAKIQSTRLLEQLCHLASKLAVEEAALQSRPTTATKAPQSAANVASDLGCDVGASQPLLSRSKSGNHLEICVFGRNGEKLYQVSVDRAMTVRQVRHQVAEASQVPLSELRLFMGDQELVDNRCVGDMSPPGSPSANVSLLRVDPEWQQFMEVVSVSGSQLATAPERLKKDRRIVMRAVERSGAALEYAVAEFRDDKDIVLKAVHDNGFALEHASKRLQNDFDIVETAVSQQWGALRFASDELRADRVIVLQAVANDGKAFQFAAEELRGDREVTLAAVQLGGLALEFASRQLKADRDVVLAAVREDGLALEFAFDEWRADREVVLEAVKMNGLALWDVSDEALKTDPEIKAACRWEKLEAGAGPSADRSRASHDHQYRALMEGFTRSCSGHEHRVEKLLSKFEQHLTNVITDGFARASKIAHGPKGMQLHAGPDGMPPHIDMMSRVSSPFHAPLEKSPAEETQANVMEDEACYKAPVQLPNALTDGLSDDHESKETAPQESEASEDETEKRPSSSNKRAWEVAPDGFRFSKISRRPRRNHGKARQTFTNNNIEVSYHVKEIAAVQEQIKRGKGFSRAATLMNLKELESLGYCARADLLMRHGVKSNSFELMSCLFIVLNAFFLGAQLEFELLNPGKELALGYQVLNMIFVTIFTLELLLRIYAERLDFCRHKRINFGWNIFDTVLVLLSYIEEILRYTQSGVSLGAMRVFRTLRVVRSFRIIRMFKVFKDLRIMLAGIMNSLRSLVWAGLLLSAIMYLTAVCLGQYAAEEIEIKTLNASEGILSKEVYAELQKYYGSLFTIVYTLFASICGGVDWADAADPIMRLGGPLGFVFLFYISFAILCVLNIITGVFVENANRLTAKDDEMVLLESMEKRKIWFEEVAELFRAADSDNSGRLDGEEFAAKMKDYRMQAWLQKIGVQVESYSAEGLFALLDFDGDGWLDFNEFANALQSVHGYARSIDLAKVNKDTRQLRKDMKELNSMCSQMIEMLGCEAAEC